MSSVDTSIYGPLIRPAQPINPLEMATRATDLKTAMVRSQLAPVELQRQQEELQAEHLKNQTAAEDAADQKTLQGIYGEVHADQSIPVGQKDEELRKRAAGKVKPRTLETLSKQMEEHQKAMQALDTGHLKQVEDVAKEVGNTAQGILTADEAKRPALYATERQRLIQSGLATADAVPEQYDEDWLKTQAAHAMGAQNAAKAELERRDQVNKDAEAARKARTEELATAAQTIDAVHDQAGYDAWRKQLSPANRALTAATFTPQNVATIKRMGLTANQQREADQASATLDETKRKNDLDAAKAAAKPTFSGDMRAALIAAKAKDPDNPSPEESATALKILHPGTDTKPVSKATLIAIESRKTKAIRDSKTKLDKDIAAATVGGKVVDQEAIDQAWEDHIQRLQDAQTGYENELTTATGGDVGHNDWADKLRVPGKAGAAPAQPSAGAPAAAGAPAQGQPAAAAQPKPAAAAAPPGPKTATANADMQLKLPDGRTVTVKKGEKVQWNGQAWVPLQAGQP